MLLGKLGICIYRCGKSGISAGAEIPDLLVGGSRTNPLFRRLASAATHRSGAFSKIHCQAIAANFFKISLAHCHSFSRQRSISSSADTRKWSKVSRLDFPFSELISTPSCRQRRQQFGGGQIGHHQNQRVNLAR